MAFVLWALHESTLSIHVSGQMLLSDGHMNRYLSRDETAGFTITSQPASEAPDEILIFQLNVDFHVWLVHFSRLSGAF